MTSPSDPPSIECSIIIPVRNESGNIRLLVESFARVEPLMPAGVEVIFVEGGSADDSWKELKRVRNAYAGQWDIKLIHYERPGKWRAVKAGFDHANGVVLVVHDGDLTVDIAAAFWCWRSIHLEGNGVAWASRTVLEGEKGAMPFPNRVANRVFAFLVRRITGYPVTDSLCGTKAVRKVDWERMKAEATELERADPFGDFTLLFGARMLGLRGEESPTRYWKRSYGGSNILHWKGGLQLLRLCWIGWRTVRRGGKRRG